MTLIEILLGLGLVITIGLIAYLYKKTQLNTSEAASRLSVNDAEKKAAALAEQKINHAQEEAQEQKRRDTNLLRVRKETLENKEVYLHDQEELLDERYKTVTELSDQLQLKREAVEKGKQYIVEAQKNYFKTIERQAKTTSEKLTQNIKEHFETTLSQELQTKNEQRVQNIKDTIDDIAEQVLEQITQVTTAEYIGDSSNPIFTITDEKDKKKLTGEQNELAERLFELTDVELSFDEEKNTVKVMCLDPIRREVGVHVVEELLAKKKTTREDVEALVKKHKDLLLEDVRLAGEFAAKEGGFPDLPDTLKVSLGKGKYRYSYGQNLLQHHLEVALLAEALAPFLHADPQKAKLAALLHDIGKVESHDDEGTPHHHISAEKYKEFFPDDEVVYNAIIAHHFDVEAQYPEAHVVRIVDAMSGARPGARRQSIEEYFEKIRQLEEIATKPTGVDHAYAIRAGREVRIFVKPKEVNDTIAQAIAEQVAQEIEETMGYPGTIKVQVIRETVAIQTANREER